MHKLTAPDGTIYFTNTPTDPDHRRTGFAVAPAPLAPTGQGSQPRGVALHFQEIAGSRCPIRGVGEAHFGGHPGRVGFNPRAHSQKGARGLMQLMPETAAALRRSERARSRENIDAGVRHLRGLVERFGSNLRLAIAAYNAGERRSSRTAAFRRIRRPGNMSCEVTALLWRAGRRRRGAGARCLP